MTKSSQFAVKLQRQKTEVRSQKNDNGNNLINPNGGPLTPRLRRRPSPSEGRGNSGARCASQSSSDFWLLSPVFSLLVSRLTQKWTRTATYPSQDFLRVFITEFDAA